MKIKFLGYVLTFILVAVIMYHLTYFLFWLSNVRAFEYATVLLLIFIIVSTILISLFRKKDCIKWVITVILGCLIGGLYAMVPTMRNKETKYYEGMVVRCTHLSEITLGYSALSLIDKWGQCVIENGDNEFYYINQTTLVGICKNRRGNNKGGYLHVYRDYNLIQKIKCEFTSGGDGLFSIYQYIDENFGSPIWSYAESEIIDPDDPYNDVLLCTGIKGIIEEKGSDDNRNSSEKLDVIINDEYVDLGPIDCYTCGFEDNDSPSKTGNYHLYVKTYQGDNFYFIGTTSKNSQKYPVTKGSWTKSGEHFNGRANTGFKYYMNISSWSSTGSNSSGNGNKGTVIIEHSGPRQEWVPCPACGNSLRVGLCQNCNGTGQDLYYTRSYRDCPTCGGYGKCNMCAGQGGHYETRY